jgi:microcystin-dependent protein
MGLETSTYIAGLTASWPVAADPKSQGDDHLRLVKGALQATFPNASKPFYFPAATVASANQTLLTTDQNKIVMLSTSGGELTVALPTLASGDAGWTCEIVKTSSDANGITVSPPSGTITSKAGSTATIRVGVLAEPARFIWSGAAWYCSKPGLVGSTINFDGTGVPAGHFTLDGSTYNSTTFAELFAMLGTTTLRDKRGRVEAGVDGGAGRLTSSVNGFGATPTLGAVGGAEGISLTVTQIPSHFHPALINESPHTHPTNANTNNSAGGTPGPFTVALPIPGAASNTAVATGIRVWDGATLDRTGLQGGSGQHSSCPPTIVTQKLIRAC